MLPRRAAARCAGNRLFTKRGYNFFASLHFGSYNPDDALENRELALATQAGCFVAFELARRRRVFFGLAREEVERARCC